MAATKCSILLIIFTLISVSESFHQKDTCSDRSCYPEIDFFPVRFPFRLVDRDNPSCGYSPAFTLTCTSNETRLHLPNSNSYRVETINFYQQIIYLLDITCFEQQLYDSSFSLSGSPFTFNDTDTYTYYNCTSSEYLKLYSVECMSTEEYMVVVMEASFDPPPGFNCSAMKTLTGPVGRYGLFVSVKLRWDEPNCSSCESVGDRCGFESHSSSEIVCRASAGHRDLSNNVNKRALLLCWVMLFMMLNATGKPP